MVRHDLKLIDFAFLLKSYETQRTYTDLIDRFIFQETTSILGFPHEVESILSHTVGPMSKFIYDFTSERIL